MRVAIHQPNYLPWLGYFAKILLSDVFVFHDIVPFSKSAVTKRTRIRESKWATETRWLTVPVQSFDSGTAIMDIRIADDEDWRKDHLRAIENTYASARFFDDAFPFLARALQDTEKIVTLAALNMELVRAVCGVLQLETAFKCASTIPGIRGMTDRPSASEVNISIVKTLGASEYLSGTGGRSYQSREEFEQSGIDLLYSNFGAYLEKHPYEQGVKQFVPGLSVVDALMHLGFDGTRALLDAYCLDDPNLS